MPSVIATTSRDVLDWKNGEVISLDEASTERLAELVTNLQDVRQALGETEQAVSTELVARCDREAVWTLRVGGFEIKTTSPTAGTTVYPPDMLETELRALVDRGTITEQAAGKALKRQVVLTLDVPLALPLKGLADEIRGLAVFKAGEKVLPVAGVDHRQVSVMAGINALRKVSGTGTALDRAKKTETGGARRAKVTVKT
jgi:hypothetical protein